jgi:hypothetical protein
MASACAQGPPDDRDATRAGRRGRLRHMHMGCCNRNAASPRSFPLAHPHRKTPSVLDLRRAPMPASSAATRRSESARSRYVPQADPTPSRGRRRRARPGPPGSTFEVQLVGGEEGRRLEQQQTEAIIEVLAWLAAYPRPRSHDRDTIRRHPRHETVDNRQHGHQRSHERGHEDRQDREWRCAAVNANLVVISDGSPGPRGGAGRSGPAAEGGRTCAGCAPGGAMPPGLAGLASVGGSSRPAGQPCSFSLS